MAARQQASNVVSLLRDAGPKRAGRPMTFEPPDTAAVSADAGAMAAERKRPLVSRLRFQLGGALRCGPPSSPHPSLADYQHAARVHLEQHGPAVADCRGNRYHRRILAEPAGDGLSRSERSRLCGAEPCACLRRRCCWFVLPPARLFPLYRPHELPEFHRVAARHGLCEKPPCGAFASAWFPAAITADIAASSGAKWLELRSQNADLSQVEGVVADLRGNLSESWERFVAKCILAGMPVYDVKNVMEALTGRVDIEHLSENSFGSVLPSNLYLKMKRAVDLLRWRLY